MCVHLTATIAGKSLVSGVIKLIPGVGTVLGAVVSGGTAALGRTYVSVLEMIARGELKQEDFETGTFKDRIRRIMQSGMDKNTTEVG